MWQWQTMRRAGPTDDFLGGTKAIIRIEGSIFTPKHCRASTLSAAWRSSSSFTRPT